MKYLVSNITRRDHWHMDRRVFIKGCEVTFEEPHMRMYIIDEPFDPGEKAYQATALLNWWADYITRDYLGHLTAQLDVTISIPDEKASES